MRFIPVWGQAKRADWRIIGPCSARNWMPTQSATSAWPRTRGNRLGMRGLSTLSNGPLDNGAKFGRGVGRGRQCLKKRGDRPSCHLMGEPGPFSALLSFLRVSARTRSHTDRTRWQLRDHRRQLVLCDLRIDQYGFSFIINSVRRKYMLGRINSYHNDAHGLPVLWSRGDVEISSWLSLPFAASAATSDRGSPFQSLGPI